MSTYFGRGTVNIGKHPLTSLSCCIGTGTLTGNRVRMCRVDRRTWNKTNPFTYTDIYFYFLTLACQEVRIEYTLYTRPINVHHKLLLFLKHWVAMESGSNTHCLHAQWLYITSRAATPKGWRKRCMAQPGLPLIKKNFRSKIFSIHKQPSPSYARKCGGSKWKYPNSSEQP